MFKQTIIVTLLSIFSLITCNLIWQRSSKDGAYVSVGINVPTHSVIASTAYLGNAANHYVEVVPFDSKEPRWQYKQRNAFLSISKHSNVFVAYSNEGPMAPWQYNCFLANSSVPRWGFVLEGGYPKVNDDGRLIAIAVPTSPGAGEWRFYNSSSSTPWFVREERGFGNFVGLLRKGQWIAVSDSAYFFHGIFDMGKKDYIWQHDGRGLREFWDYSPSGIYAVQRKMFESTLHKWDGQTYQPIWTKNSKINTMHDLVSVQDDGHVIYVWYDYEIRSIYVDYHNPTSETPLWRYEYGRQNEPDQQFSLAVTSNGKYWVVGSKGTSSPTNEQVRVFAHNRPTPLWKLRTAGAVREVDIEQIGNTLHVVAGTNGKDGNGGELYYGRVTVPE